MNGVGRFPTPPGYTPGYNPVVLPGYEPTANDDDDDGINRGRPMMLQPLGDYNGPDDQGNYPDIEEPIIASAAEEQQLTNPFAGMFADTPPQRDSMYDNQEKMAKYNSSFSRRISDLSGDAVLSAFFDAVRNNDTEWVEPALEDKDVTSPIRNEEHRRTALVVAIKNRHIEMVKLLLEHNAPIGNAFFHAAQVSSTAVVKTLCDHLKGKKAILDSALNSFSEDADFSHVTTPLMKASCDNDHEIVKLFIEAGAEMPTIEAVLARVSESAIPDIYERALARLHWHKAMSSEAYLLFGSDDPVQAAFEAGHIIDETVSDQLTHIKPQYNELIVKLDTFLTNYLEMTQNSAEISTLLTQATAKEEGSQKSRGGESLPTRLLDALDLKFNQFVAHNNLQQYILDRWYLYHTEWEELPKLVFTIRTAFIFFLMPILCSVYIVFPIQLVQRFMKMPFVRFVLQMASRIAFLLFLIYSTISTSTDQKIAAKGSEADGLTKTVEQLHEERVEHYLEYRGCPAHFVIWLIYVWIFGNTWRELKELWRQGYKDYLSEMFNWVDIVQLGLYWIAIILNMVSYFQAAAHVKSHEWGDWDSCAVEQPEDFGSDYGSPVEKEPEDARAIHAKFECESRTDWDAFDPLLVSEGCFAMATVLTFLGALKDTVILSFVGPLRISLGGMILDIVRFFVLFFFLWISFSIGITQLYETFMVLKTLECESGEDCHPAFLSFSSTMGTLFWSLFDLADIEELEVHPEAGMVFTESVGLLLYASYLIIAVVVMLNALIAMMSNTYTRVEENSEIEWKVERSKLMVDYVCNCPTLPSPFNLVPTPKFVYRVCTRLYLCCCQRKSMKEKKMDEARDRSVRENQYKLFIQALTDRYINGLRTSQQSEDDNERLQMELSSLKEMLRLMRHQMRDIKTVNSDMQANVKSCVTTMTDMMGRQKRLEDQQAQQLRLLKAGSRGGSQGVPTPPPATSPSPVPRPEEVEERFQPDVAELDEADRENTMRALAESLDELPWIDSEV